MDCIPGTEIPKPKVKLSGFNGNSFAIMGKIKMALKRAGAPSEVVSEYLSKSTSGDYDNVICTAMEYANVE